MSNALKSDFEKPAVTKEFPLFDPQIAAAQHERNNIATFFSSRATSPKLKAGAQNNPAPL